MKLLSEKQKDLKVKIDIEKRPDKIKELRYQRNEILTEIHLKLREKEQSKIEKHLNEIENTKDNPSRMFHAMKQMQKMRPKVPLIIKTENDNLTANEKQQSSLIKNYFESQFFKTNNIVKKVKPHQMTTLFTSNEIKIAIKTLQNK